jgi:hypothetical protein
MSLLRSEGQDETIRFHLRPEPRHAGFSYGRLRSIPLAGLALICLKNETKADAERDLRELISAAGADVGEKACRERLLRQLESADKGDPLELARYSLERAGVSVR